MRIVSGKFRGRKLHPPAGLPVRPTTDFAKEGLFNILDNLVDFEELDVLDLFSGTGSIAFEFLSREAKSVTAVDINNRCLDFIEKTSEHLKSGNIRIIREDVFRFMERSRESYDLIFADPPYDLADIKKIPDFVMKSGILRKTGWFILEHGAGDQFDLHPRFIRHRKYGNVNFSFFRQEQLPEKGD